jgi:hypothetical protein
MIRRVHGVKRRGHAVCLATLGTALLGAAAFLVALPALLSTAAGNRVVRAALDRELAPHQLQLVGTAIHLSWLGPQTLDGGVLYDTRARTVVMELGRLRSPLSLPALGLSLHAHRAHLRRTLRDIRLTHDG